MSHAVSVVKTIRPRVLVIVRGGVAEVCADESVDVVVVDYDNEPVGQIPVTHVDLINQQ